MPRRKKATELPTNVQIDTNSYVPVIGKAKEKVLTKNQTEFNKKVKRIESLKKEIGKIEEQLEYARLLVINDLFPLMGVVKEKQKKYIYLLDTAFESGFFKKRDSETLMEHILELCEHVLSKPEFEDEGKMAEDADITEIQKKYDALLYTEEENEMLDESAKEMMSKMLGIDIDLDELRKNPSAYFQKKQQELEQEQIAFAERQANRKKTKKQIEKEEKLAEEKKVLTKDIRTIYTSLAKELHPDLEQDEQERQRKTEMMKRVTAAYEANDLFELLRLQLEYQIQHERIDGLVEEQLKRYNQLLQSQISELERQKFEMIGFGTPSGMIYHKYCAQTPQATLRIFKREKAELQHIVDSLQDSINTHTDYKVLKEFLKEVRKEYKEREKESIFESFMGRF
jgi:DNA-binding transcriptional regulator YbjK